MKIYLVGGAVRDKLLGLAVKEKDWVVVGATPEEMIAQGYRQVGNSFPVFLHPDTHEEYALARLERKTAPGYSGFEFDTSKKVTLEEDLQRRDLTINAIAEDNEGQLIDPYHGQDDIKDKVLRHVSPAFSEDPVRVLRTARFAARFFEHDFQIAETTVTLMKAMVQAGEVDALVAERVWQEMEKTLREHNPQVFFTALQSCDALIKIFPEESNPTIGLACLQHACRLSDDPTIRFAAWACHLGDDNVRNLCARLKVPKEFSELALLTTRHIEVFRKAVQLPPPAILDALKSLDGFRRIERFEKFLLTGEAVLRAMPGNQQKPRPQREYLHAALLSARAVTAGGLTKMRLEGEALARELDAHRRAAISKVKRTYHWSKFD